MAGVEQVWAGAGWHDRFGSGGYMQMLGIVRAEGWKEAYPRFRAVRDGVDTR